MLLKPWTICFFQEGHAPEDDGSTIGCSVVQTANSAVQAEWHIRPYGAVLAGTYRAVLTDLEDAIQSGFRVDALLAFFTQNIDIEAFLKDLSRMTSGLPIVGGVAARTADSEQGHVVPAAQDVSLLVIQDDRWQFSGIWHNMYEISEKAVQFRAAGPRTILSVRETDFDSTAQQWYQAKRSGMGYRNDNFANIALSSREGLNYHVSFAGDIALHTGADLPYNGELLVASISDDDAQTRFTAFCSQSDALIISCAGFLPMFHRTINAGQGVLAGFLEGEIVTIPGGPKLGNLMLTGLMVKPKNRS